MIGVAGAVGSVVVVMDPMVVDRARECSVLDLWVGDEPDRLHPQRRSPTTPLADNGRSSQTGQPDQCVHEIVGSQRVVADPGAEPEPDHDQTR